MNSNKTIIRILGKEGRTTIPFEFRVKNGFEDGDILSFEALEDGSVRIRREVICQCHSDAHDEDEAEDLLDYLDNLDEEDQKSVLLHLMCGYLSRLGCKANA